ncbi:helix-turn-helix transcriptional regulator [Ignatzschineria rhizosphaerae]|uniref:Helix-turn-helix transcriptional regulator n=1 Tax=Ignatzschineria rhizosphaerae TaxID=2923279 RepID=A0ABY3X2N5_9GAMM|nr:helix-turn-helix domain-containing protein [Ignatzschineria rhizosphaerae]UNM97152.1 helix-turn-helix transcriptional regulator [Ignatzschineria rhizosphaerae]
MKDQNIICPVALTLSLIEGKWKTLILRDLLEGKKRFGELQRSVEGISQKVLTTQLRALEANGIVERIAYAEIPPRVEYQLSPQGQSLHAIIDAMRIWGENYQMLDK